MKTYKKLFWCMAALGLLIFMWSNNKVSADTIAPIRTVGYSVCGSGAEAVLTSIDFGCDGSGCLNTHSNPVAPYTAKAAISAGAPTYCRSDHSALTDILFAVVRFISDGVGLVIIASLIIAGIQYTFSRGEPRALVEANKRIYATSMALLLYIFAYALLNYIIPNGFLGQ